MKFAAFVLLPILFVGLGVVAFVTLRDDAPRYRGGGSGVSSGAAVATISTGEPVDLAAHAVAGGRTVFEYTADW